MEEVMDPRPQDMSALSADDALYGEDGDAKSLSSRSDVDDTHSDVTGQFGPHMLRVQDIEDMQ